MPTPNKNKERKVKEDYTCRDLFTVEEVVYRDGTARYSIKGENEEGTFSSGMFNEIDLIIEILVKIGKISEPKVYVSK